MKSLKYAMIGTGAVGGTYGTRLALAGLDVHFFLHSDLEYVRKNGLTFISPQKEKIHLKSIQAWSFSDDFPKVDVACIALKDSANHLLPKLLPKLLKEDGLVLNLQNGLGLEEQIATYLKPEQILAGLCFICAQKTAPGTIEHLDYGNIRIAPFDSDAHSKKQNPNMNQIVHDFESANIPVETMDNLQAARWHKLVWNIPFNGLCALHKLDTTALLQNSTLKKESFALMKEVQRVAHVQGFTIEDSFLHKMMDYTEKMIPYSPSMKVDRDLERPLELDVIYREPLKKAHEFHTSMPKTKKLLLQLESL